MHYSIAGQMCHIVRYTLKRWVLGTLTSEIFVKVFDATFVKLTRFCVFSNANQVNLSKLCKRLKKHLRSQLVNESDDE